MIIELYRNEIITQKKKKTYAMYTTKNAYMIYNGIDDEIYKEEPLFHQQNLMIFDNNNKKEKMMILYGILGQTGNGLEKNKKDKKIKEPIEHYRIKNINDDIHHFKFKDRRDYENKKYKKLIENKKIKKIFVMMF